MDEAAEAAFEKVVMEETNFSTANRAARRLFVAGMAEEHAKWVAVSGTSSDTPEKLRACLQDMAANIREMRQEILASVGLHTSKGGIHDIGLVDAAFAVWTAATAKGPNPTPQGHFWAGWRAARGEPHAGFRSPPCEGE